MPDDLENYEITPEDLGCLGEQENPPGLVEETVGKTKVPVPKSFKHIPFEKKKHARKLYDAIDDKDMSFEDFCIALYALQSPALMQADLQDVIMEKQGRNRAMAANLRNVEQRRN